MSSVGTSALMDAQRYQLSDVFFSTGIVINQTNLQINLGGIALAGRISMPASGRIVGIVWELNTVVTAGTLTISVFKNGSSSGVSKALTSASAVRGVHSQTPVSFAATDSLDIRYTSDAGLLGPGTGLFWITYVIDG